MRIDGTQMTRIKQMNADRNEPGVASADLAPWRWIMERRWRRWSGWARMKHRARSGPFSPPRHGRWYSSTTVQATYWNLKRLPLRMASGANSGHSHLPPTWCSLPL